MVLKHYVNDLWIASSLLQALLCGILLFRRTWSRFPAFTVYTAFNLFEAAITFAVSKNVMLYFFTYWACQAVSIILGLAVIYEIFNALFASHSALKKTAKMIFCGVGVVLVLLGGVVVILELSTNPHVFRANPQVFSFAMWVFSNVVMVSAEAARFVEVGMLMFLFLFSSALGLHWKAHEFGIGLGLGVFVAVDLVNVTLRSHLGNGVPGDILNLARGSAFCLSVLIWTTYLVSPEHVTISDEVPKTAQLEQWNQAVMELINR
jgi:hypothetical protein